MPEDTWASPCAAGSDVSGERILRAPAVANVKSAVKSGKKKN
jgi:hypothetical protein